MRAKAFGLRAPSLSKHPLTTPQAARRGMVVTAVYTLHYRACYRSEHLGIDAHSQSLRFSVAPTCHLPGRKLHSLPTNPNTLYHFDVCTLTSFLER